MQRCEVSAPARKGDAACRLVKQCRSGDGVADRYDPRVLQLRDARFVDKSSCGALMYYAGWGCLKEKRCPRLFLMICAPNYSQYPTTLGREHLRRNDDEL